MLICISLSFAVNLLLAAFATRRHSRFYLSASSPNCEIYRFRLERAVQSTSRTIRSPASLRCALQSIAPYRFPLFSWNLQLLHQLYNLLILDEYRSSRTRSRTRLSTQTYHESITGATRDRKCPHIEICQDSARYSTGPTSESSDLFHKVGYPITIPISNSVLTSVMYVDGNYQAQR